MNKYIPIVIDGGSAIGGSDGIGAGIGQGDRLNAVTGYFNNAIETENGFIDGGKETGVTFGVKGGIPPYAHGGTGE